MQWYVRGIGTVSQLLGRTCGIFYLAAIGLSGFEVFMRYALGAPTSWTSETIMMLVATAWLACVGAVTERRRHITVTTMELVIGERAWRRLSKIAILISMLAVAGLVVMLWEPMAKVLKAPQTSGSAFDPPTPTYVKTALVVAGVLYFLQLLANFLQPAAPAAPASSAAPDGETRPEVAD